jgi:hypothetical protein
MILELNELAIATLTVVVLSAIILAERQSVRSANNENKNSLTWHFSVGLIIWIVATAAYSSSGALQQEPGLMMTAMLPAFIGLSAIALTSIGLRIARRTPWFVLIGFHAFRIVIELVFHNLYMQDRLPIQVTYHGLNYDISTGISACVLCLWAIFARPPRIVVIFWNTIGMALVATIVVVATLSMPGPLRQFTNEPSTILMSTFPFIWVPTFLAPVALAGHLVVYRKLLLERTEEI